LVIKDRIAGAWRSAQRLGLFGLPADVPGAPASDVVFHPPVALTVAQWAALSPELQGWWLGLQDDLPPPSVPTTPYAAAVARWVQGALVAAFPGSLTPSQLYDRATPMGQALARGLHAGLFADPHAPEIAAAWKESPKRIASAPVPAGFASGHQPVRPGDFSAPRTSATHPLCYADIPVGSLFPVSMGLDPSPPTEEAAPPSHGTAGAVLITFCPGKTQPHPISGPAWARDLDADLVVLGAGGATDVVSLITPAEMAELGVENLGERITAKGLRWAHLPIQDGRTPDGVEDSAASARGAPWSVHVDPAGVGWSVRRDPRWPGEIVWTDHEYAVLNALADRLAHQGARVVVHCKGGLGRAGTVAALLLAGAAHARGEFVPVDRVVATIRTHRRDAIETAVQERFLARKIVPGVDPCVP
jgi:protein-tyrosine phosphatase